MVFHVRQCATYLVFYLPFFCDNPVCEARAGEKERAENREEKGCHRPDRETSISVGVPREFICFVGGVAKQQKPCLLIHDRPYEHAVDSNQWIALQTSMVSSAPPVQLLR